MSRADVSRSAPLGDKYSTLSTVNTVRNPPPLTYTLECFVEYGTEVNLVKLYVCVCINTQPARFSLSSTNSSLRDRSALLGNNDYANGSTPSHSGRSSPYDSYAYRNRTADELESQNDEELEGLSAKVKMLKDVGLFACYNM